MIQSHRPLVRSLLVSLSVLALFATGCHKKPAGPELPTLVPEADT